ncbi:MAG: twin transmembrane helix small protein [Robiginitomaculum sp.]|nr:twin transmembrane helix small protein [Robiginitomaculum sp.]
MLIINIIIGLALLTVFVSLVLGALNMRKPGQSARLKSNKLMRLRVAAQFVAVLALILMVYIRSKSGG